MRKARVIILILLITGLLGCDKITGTDISIDQEKEEMQEQEGKAEMVVIDAPNVEDIQYKGEMTLTPENLEETMRIYLCIKNKEELSKLEGLPLTEEFFEQSLRDFPYVHNAANIKRFWLDLYGIGEDDTMMCICIFSPSDRNTSRIYDEHYTYYIKMKLKDDQIDSMDIKLLDIYLPEES